MDKASASSAEDCEFESCQIVDITVRSFFYKMFFTEHQSQREKRFCLAEVATIDQQNLSNEIQLINLAASVA